MNTLPIELLALSAGDLWDDLNYQLVGFFIVLITLTGLWIALEIIGSIFRSVEKRRSTGVATVDKTDAAELDLEIYAVIAAAVDAVIGHPHEIVSISSGLEDRSKPSEGDRSIEEREEVKRSKHVR